jgi:hypothetical protein
MKTVLTILLTLTFTVLLFSQEEDNNVQFGFGVSISSEYTTYIYSELQQGIQIATLPIDMANFSIIVKNNFIRFEPSFGYFTQSIDYNDATYSAEYSNSNIRVGAVVAFNNTNIESMNFYYGIDFGFIFSSRNYTSNNSDESDSNSKTDFFIGPAIGGEYLFIKHFSFGGEINLNYISIGQYDSETDISSWAMSTRGLIYLRWYVN